MTGGHLPNKHLLAPLFHKSKTYLIYMQLFFIWWKVALCHYLSTDTNNIFISSTRSMLVTTKSRSESVLENMHAHPRVTCVVFSVGLSRISSPVVLRSPLRTPSVPCTLGPRSTQTGRGRLPACQPHSWSTPSGEKTVNTVAMSHGTWTHGRQDADIILQVTNYAIKIS